MLARLSLLLLSALQLSQAVDVYLYPPTPILASTLSPDDSSAALSRHLGLEAFEPLQDVSHGSYEEESFVGQGPDSALLLTVDEVDAKDILPLSLEPSFKLSTPHSVPISSLSSVISTYLHRASHSYSSIFSAASSPWQVNAIPALSSFFDRAEESAFAALELARLAELRQTYGPFSEEYNELADELRSFLEQLVDEGKVNLAILTFDSSETHTPSKREPAPQTSTSTLATVPTAQRPAPQQPIGAISTCFTTADACNNSTSSCSGRGTCVQASKAGRTCFVCTCGTTKTGEGSKVKTDYWAGQSCERKDVSGPFVLLVGTVIVMILLAVGSVSLLYSVGDQPLPSTLLATAVTAKKD